LDGEISNAWKKVKKRRDKSGDAGFLLLRVK